MSDDNTARDMQPLSLDGNRRSEKRLRELALLALATDLDFDSKIQSFLKLGCEGLRMEVGVLAGIDQDIFHIEHAVSASGPAPAGFDCDVRDTLCNETWAQNGTLAIEHVGLSVYRTHPAHARFKVEAYIGAVVVVSGSKYGTVYFSSTTPHSDKFTEADKEFVRLMALWVGSEIERRQNLHELENSYDTRSTALVSMARREALLGDIGLALRTTLDSDEIERLAAERLAGVLSADRCFFIHFDLERDYMRFSGETRRGDLQSIVGEHKPSGFGVEVEPLFEGGRTLTVDDIMSESWPQRTVLALTELNIHSLIAVPLVYGGRLEAALCVTMDSARAWTDEEIALVEAVSAQTRTSVEAVALIRRERRIATTLQEALLPPIPDVLPGLLLAHEYRAALDESSVGGDFYAVYSLDNGCHVLVIGDVSGKGLAAASQVGGLQSMLRYALYAATGLSEAVTQLNAIVAQHDLLEGFATLFVGIYDAEQHILKYCNCGHESPLILSGGTVQSLETTGPPIGAVRGVKYQERSVQLALGDLIVMYTDGLSEAGSDRRLLLGQEGLAEILTRRGQAGEMHEIASLIMTDVLGFASGRLRDDACLLVIRLANTSDPIAQPSITAGGSAPQAWTSDYEPPRETSTEGQFRLLVDSVTDYAIFLLDTTGHVVTWNRGAERLKGYTASEIVGKHFSIFYTPEDVQRGHPLDELEIASVDGRYEEEGWRVRRDGSRFWANVVITAVRDSSGELRGFGKVTRDFTERRRAEQQLRLSEERFRHLVVGVRDYAIFMLDPEGNIVSWNEGAERLKGYRSHEIIGQHFSRFYSPEDLAADKPRHELEVAADVGRYEEEGWRLRKDGTKFWANVVITALKDDNGNLYGYAKVTRDFTDRRRVEDELRRSEERFRLLVQGVRDYAIFAVDPDGTVASWNEGAEHIKGYKAEEIIGKHFSMFYTPADIQRDHPAHELATAAAEGRYEEEGWRLRKDGTKFWANVVITALKDDKGGLYGYAKVTRDITDRRAAEIVHLQNLRDEISRSFLRDVLYSVTEGRLRFCEDDTQLPVRMECIVSNKLLGGTGLAALRKYTRDAAAMLGFHKDREADIVTAASEAAMNAIVHAKLATYSVCHSESTIQNWVTDRGTGIELNKLHRATLERGFSSTQNSLGHGFWLMLHTCDRLWLRSTSSGTTVVIEQDVTLLEPEWLSRPRELADYLIINE